MWGALWFPLVPCATPPAPLVLPASTHQVAGQHRDLLRGYSKHTRVRHKRHLPAIAGGAAAAAVAAAVSGQGGFRNQARSSSTKNVPQEIKGRHSKGPLRETVALLQRALEVDLSDAEAIAETLQRWTVGNEGEDRTGARTKRWARRLVRGLGQHPAVRSILFRDGGDVIAAIAELEKRSQSHGKRVEAIERQHRAVRDGDGGDLEEYGEASSYMGRQWWLRAIQDQIATWVDEYFLLSPERLRFGHRNWVFRSGGLPRGWKRYKVKDRVLYWNPDEKRMQVKAPSTMERATPPESREPPVTLLDIGSCNNAFDRYPFLITPTAIDLQPSSDSEGVFKADFFDVPILHVENCDQQLLISDDGKLEGIEAGSFDVVVVSLVLSYISEPAKRIEMIARARRCLRDDRGLFILVEVASALADKSWYQGDATSDWTNAVEAVGFRIKRFEENVREKYPFRSHEVYQWVFETAPIQDTELKPLLTPREMPW